MTQMCPLLDACMALPRETLDFQLSPSRSAKDADGVLAELMQLTRHAKSDPDIDLVDNIPYGPRPRARMDLFRPTARNAALPCLVFIHGGFWQEGDKSVSGFAARTFTRMGWAYVSLGYTLTPEASLREVMAEVQEALAFLHAEAVRLGIDQGRIVLAGHSAGGHLAASILAGIPPGAPSLGLAGAVLISGVFDLAPIAKSYVSVQTPIHVKDIPALSPLRHRPVMTPPVQVLIGADEPDAFQVQSDALMDQWGPELPDLTREITPGRDHFDILFELSTPGSHTIGRVCAMV